MPISEKARFAEAIHRKLRAIAAVLLDPAATKHERTNAEALKIRLEKRLRQEATSEGTWVDTMFWLAGRLRKSSNPHLRPLPRATGQIMPSDLAERFVEGSRSSEGLGQTLGAQGPTMPPIAGLAGNFEAPVATSRTLKCLELLSCCAQLVATRLNPPHSTTRVSVTHLLPYLDYSLLGLCRLNVQCLSYTRPNASPNVPATYGSSWIMISVSTQFGRVLYIYRRERRLAADHVGSPFGNHNDRCVDITADEIWHH
jgi:hypothetical protein